MSCESVELVVDAEDEDSFKRFKKWLIASGFNPPEHLKLVTFKDSGIRGLMTTRCIKENEILVSIPENLLITTETVITSIIGPYVKNFCPKLSPLRALCAFLMVERCRGSDSEWRDYAAVLPESYTTPLFWPSHSIRDLPNPLQECVRRQKIDLKCEYVKLRPFLKLVASSLHLPDHLLDFSLFRWAWFSVNTRCVYMRRQKPAEDLNPESDCCALAPFLDLLNHSCHAKVRAGFNASTRSYDVVTLAPIAKFEQVYISYGFHDNAKLLLEYGFVLGGNPHSVVYFTVEEVLNAVEDAHGFSDRKRCSEGLSIVGMSRDLCCTRDGPSWCLTSAVDLLVGHHVFKRFNGTAENSKKALKVLFETRLRHLRLKKEKLQSKRLSRIHVWMPLELLNEEIELLTAGVALTDGQ